MGKQKIKIGIDIDDVLLNTVEGFLKYFNKKYGKNISLGDITEYPYYKILGFDKKEDCVNEVYYYHSNDEINSVKIPEEVSSSLNILSEYFDLFLITSRKPEIETITRLILKKFFPTLIFKLVFSGDFHKNGNLSKSQICIGENIPFLIEDDFSTSLDCAEKGIKVFLMDKPWNQNYSHKNIVRVNDWSEILEKLKLEVGR